MHGSKDNPPRTYLHGLGGAAPGSWGGGGGGGDKQVKHFLRHSQQAGYTFHMCRRGGALILSSIGQAIPEIANFGYWDSLATARKYASLDHPMRFVPTRGMPFPPTSGLLSTFSMRRVNTMYPASLFPYKDTSQVGGGGGEPKEESEIRRRPRKHDPEGST